MKAIADCPASVWRKVRFLLTDIDDTLTTDGLLPASSLQAIENLVRAGISVIPVTGRPAGWCDHIARMWPVSAVVGENGAFYFSYDRQQRRMHRWYQKKEEERQHDRHRLLSLARDVLEAVPGSAIASDQAYRVSDQAIDFCEDVAPLPESDIERIVAILEAGGATTKVSSIHVNAWFGDYNKLATSRKCLSDLFQCDLDTENERIVFIGDSPNDEPMFAHFANSIGVANVRNFRLQSEPSWVTQGSSAYGFKEAITAMTQALLSSS